MSNRNKKIKRRVKTEIAEINRPLVHGFMVYECEDCGSVYKMYLEKGLEDRVQDAQEPEKHKPVPFMIVCKKCGGFHCKHILWGIGDRDEYTYLRDGESYFKNDPDQDCGKPIVRKSYADLETFKRVMLYGE